MKLTRKNILTKEQMDKISQAVEAAEKGTSGEISTAVIKESSNYIVFEFMFMIIFGFVAALLLQILGPGWQSFWEGRIWSLESYQLSSISIGTIFLVMGIAYLIANTSLIDRLIVPKKVMARKVAQKAAFHFFDAGLTHTTERTAILIFISLNERRVELIADKGISDKIKSEVWESIVADLGKKITCGDMSGGLVDAVGACGTILKKEFPQKGNGKNQLSDSVQVVED